VAARRERWSRVEPEQAALADRSILGAFGQPLARRIAFLDAGTALRCHRGNLAVGRIDDERRPAAADHLRAAVPPEVVIGERDVRRDLRAVHLTARRLL